VYHPFLKTIKAYKCAGGQMITLLGLDDEEDLIHTLQGVPKLSVFDLKESPFWGYLIYSVRKATILCKLSKSNDVLRNATYPTPQGTPGTIVSDPHYGSATNTDEWSKGQIEFLIKYHPHIMKRGDLWKNKLIAKNSAPLYSLLVELCMIEDHTMFSQELAWWGFLKRS